MAGNIYISEYTAVGQKYGQTIGSVRQPALAEQQVAVGAGSVQSTAFNANTAIVRISVGSTATTGVVLKFGTNPTAATSGGIRMSTGQSEYFVVDNAANKVAVIASTE